MTSRKTINRSWYNIGFNDGRFNIHKFDWKYFSEIKTGYALGLKAGKKQRKEDTLIKLLQGNKGEDD